jgi:hypothetical protein
MNQRAASDCRPPDEARRIAVEYRQAAGANAEALTQRSQSAIQCLPVRPRISLIRLTMRVTSRSALKKAAEVMPDVRKNAVALLLA